MKPSFVPRAVMAFDMEKLQSVTVGGILVQDIVVFCFCCLATYLWIKLFGLLSDRDVVDRKTSRKLLHITTGPIFVMTWILYSTTLGGQLIAAVVPLANAFRIIANGTGFVADQSFVKSMSRDGSKSELLTGPLFYCLTVFFVTSCFWRQSVTSFLTIGVMAGGDGMADIIGRRFGKHKLPYNEKKSVEGSLAFIVFGSLTTLGLAGFFYWTGFLKLQNDFSFVSIQIVLITMLCALVESSPLTSKFDDNLLVPTVAIALSTFMSQGP